MRQPLSGRLPHITDKHERSAAGLVAGDRRGVSARPIALQRVLELGPREVELLTILWRYGDATANQVYHRLKESSVTVNTIHSALERLHRKGFVVRDKSGRSFLYRPTLTREQLICQSLVIVADRLAGGDKDLMIDAIAAYLRSGAGAMTPSARQKLLAGLY